MPTVVVTYDLPREKRDLETALLGEEAVEVLDILDAYLDAEARAAESQDAGRALGRARDQLRALRRGERPRPPPDDDRPTDE